MICRTRPPRLGFTLPELMVTMLVVAILMTILGVAVSISGSLVGQARGRGAVMDQQRVAMNTLVRDLKHKHFVEDGNPNGRERLSDLRTDRAYEYKDPAVMPPAVRYKWAGYKPPRGGYFRAYSPPVDNTFNFFEGTDGDGFGSSRSGNHSVMFTVLVPGGAPQDTLTADVPFMNTPFTNSYPITFHAAEVAYFLVQTGTTPGGVKLYNLIRRQRGCAMNQYDAAEYTKLLNTIPTGSPNPLPHMAKDDPIQVVAAVDRNPPGPGAANFEVFDLSLLTLAGNRVPQAAITTHRVGDDVLLSNVISFELKYTGSSSIGWPRGAATNTDFPYDTLPHDGSKFGGLYDTFNALQGDWDDAKYLAGSTTATTTPVAVTPPLCPIRITGVSIRLRVWDPKSKTSRQTTKNVDL